MTDFYGRVLEVEEAEGRPCLRVTKDRSWLLRDALEVLGFKPLTLDEGVRSHQERVDSYEPEDDILAFPDDMDIDRLQDTLDELEYRPGGEIVKRVL